MTQISKNLYRAIIDGTFIAVDPTADPDSEAPVEGVLYPRTEASTHFDRFGREWTRRAEMTVFSMQDDAMVDIDGGTVLFDVAGWFGYAGWRYFELPEGTVLPESLKIERSRHITSNLPGSLQGRRHVIVPLTRMSLEAFKAALDHLARNAVVRQIELAR